MTLDLNCLSMCAAPACALPPVCALPPACGKLRLDVQQALYDKVGRWGSSHSTVKILTHHTRWKITMKAMLPGIILSAAMRGNKIRVCRMQHIQYLMSVLA